MKKRFLAIASVLLFLFTYTACSTANEEELAPPLNESDSGGYYDGGTTSSESVVYSTASTAAGSTQSDYVRKIVKNGSMTLKSKDVEKTYADILAYAKQYDGYEFSQTKRVDDDSTYITAEIKLKPEGLDSVMSYAGEAAEILSADVTSDDITSSYYDAQIRLQTKEKALEKYYQFLQEAKNTEEILSIQNYINSLTLEIESLKGQIKMWDALVDESVLELSIYEKNDSIKIDDEVVWNSISFSDMGSLIKVGFSSVINVIISVLQWIVIILISVSPLLVIAAVIFLVVRWIIKKNSKKKPPQFGPPQQ